MPTCAARMASIGQSFCTGRRRTDRSGRRVRRRRHAHQTDAWCPGPSCQAASPSDESWPAISSARQRSLIAMNSGVSVAPRSRGRAIGTGMVSMMRPGRVAMTWTSSER